MNLQLILNGIKNYKILGKINKNIKNIVQNSAKCSKKSLFFCIDGTKTNGIIYINEAINNGANSVVLDKKYYDFFKHKKEIKIKSQNEIKKQNITYIFVEDVRKAMAIMSANFYGNPQQKLKVVGITGTNGKTSCSYIIAKLLKLLGKKVGVIGTSGIFINNKKFESTMTTPDSIELFEIFSKMVKAKIEYCVMEVSAHAIFFDKIYGINFSAKALTNVKTDHLDFFKTQSKYEQTKISFFDNDNIVILNNDDKIGKKIAKNNQNCITFGQNNANFQFFDMKCNLGKTQFYINNNNDIYKITSKLTGKFNLQNLVLSVAVLSGLGFDIQKVISKIKYIKNIDGRFDLIYSSKDFNVIIDYAHTLDSLKNLLLTVKQVSKNKNIIVFGCPGERDTEKRFLMGQSVAKFCDCAILTTDNPASENPKRIMFEIEQGVKSQNCECRCFLVENREKAIKKAIKIAKNQKNINILIVGKGVEKYQIIGDRHIPYCDYDVAKKLLDDNKHNK